MIELNNALKYAKVNVSKAVNITQDSLEKPVNVTLFNHTLPDSSTYITSKECFIIDNNIFMFSNIKSLYGAIIKSPKSQYIFCNEVCDCVAIGGTVKDKNGSTHIFGAHVYESILKFQMQNIIDELLKHDLTPEKVIYSPRVDTSSWQSGLKILENNFSETINILRDNENQSEMIVGIEGIILNDMSYEF